MSKVSLEETYIYDLTSDGWVKLRELERQHEWEQEQAAIDEAEAKICPYCRGTNQDLDGGTGGGCVHCFNGVTR